MGRKVIPIEIKLWSRVTKTDTCWLWTGSTNIDGYGKIHHFYDHLAAHKVSYELLVGPIPEGLYVLHTCDNPPCVNPAHLYIGTHQDNMDDVAKRHRRAGEKHHNAKLTETEVVLIRTMLCAGHKHKELAILFSVTKAAITDINTRRSWSHI